MADNHQRRVLLFLALFSCFLCSSFGYQFVVGGRDGWIVNPSENYNQWAERNRFQVNDTLLFQYKKGSNSVLVVNKDDYDKCNTGNPIVKLEDGNSVFKFDRSGPFYFVSGDKASCDRGQKLIVVVLAVRSPPQPRPPTVVSPPIASPPQGSSSSPSPAGPGGPTISPSSGSPAPAKSPSSPSPAGGAPSPATSPSSPSQAGGAPSPATSPSSPSPAGGAPTPASSPSSLSPASEAPAPSNSPLAPSPAGGAPGPASDTLPDSPSSSITPGAPGSSTPGSPGSSAPGSGTPADANARRSPPPRSLAAPSDTPSIVLMSLVVSVVLGGFMV